MDQIRKAFLGAFESIAPLIGSEELELRWNDQSCLEGSTVRGLAGHLVRAGIAPFAYLEGDPPSTDPVEAPHYYATVLAKMTAADHAEVPRRGEQMAGPAVAELRSLYEDALARARESLPNVDARRVLSVFMDIPIDFDDYLTTRIVEILVHADDLAVSLDLPMPEPPADAMDAALEHLLAVAREQTSDHAVLVGFTRRERDSIDALRVFRAVPADQ